MCSSGFCEPSSSGAGRSTWTESAPTPFVVRLPGGEERYACCAIDALGIAPMLGQRVEIRSRCHHCKTPLEFRAAPDGPGTDADGVMLWLGKRAKDRRRVADSL